MFWGDFLANTMHLTPQEAGAYLFLIAHAWEHGGKIAGADVQRVARVNNRNWHRVRARIAPFFSISSASLSDATLWTSERVSTELTKAAEISNKRKEAALQMHSKSRANGHANHPPSTTTTTFKDTSLGKGSRGMSPDLGNDYRSPPRSKSDNPLTPIPDRPLASAKRP